MKLASRSSGWPKDFDFRRRRALLLVSRLKESSEVASISSGTTSGGPWTALLVASGSGGVGFETRMLYVGRRLWVRWSLKQGGAAGRQVNPRHGFGVTQLMFTAFGSVEGVQRAWSDVFGHLLNSFAIA